MLLFPCPQLTNAIMAYTSKYTDMILPSNFYRIPRTIGVAIPMKATFFMTYIMVDGWAGIANEILRVKPLVIYHLKNMFIVKTERDRERAMDPGSIGLAENLPSLQLYFLLGLVYAVVTPILLPFIIIFFAFAFLVYRHQVSLSVGHACCFGFGFGFESDGCFGLAIQLGAKMCFFLFRSSTCTTKNTRVLLRFGLRCTLA